VVACQQQRNEHIKQKKQNDSCNKTAVQIFLVFRELIIVDVKHKTLSVLFRGTAAKPEYSRKQPFVQYVKPLSHFYLSHQIADLAEIQQSRPLYFFFMHDFLFFWLLFSEFTVPILTPDF
jgi:hypothetical protein